MDTLPTPDELSRAAGLVGAVLAPTAAWRWPLLAQRCGADVWVKHENHTPIGAFKIRGGLVYLDELRRSAHPPRGLIAATRGNHGQSLAFAASRLGLSLTIVVPHGNSREKNAAMSAQGARLIEHGRDFQEALEFAAAHAVASDLTMVPSFHRTLVAGVATYALEFFHAVPDLDTIYVPIGLGSGICGVIAARESMRLKTRVVGVVAEQAPAYAESFAARRPVATATANTIADGIACRVPDPAAVAIINHFADRVVMVADAQIETAIGHYFTDTHNVAEGAGAAPLAALLNERELMRGKRVGLVLSGGNIDREPFARILAGDAT